MKKLDILKVVAFANVYGLDLYGTKFTNLDCGKNNLASYFVDKLGWSMDKLKKIFSLLKKEDIFEIQIGQNGLTKVLDYKVSKFFLGLYFNQN